MQKQPLKFRPASTRLHGAISGKTVVCTLVVAEPKISHGVKLILDKLV
jgi:hypothetical protein